MKIMTALKSRSAVEVEVEVHCSRQVEITKMVPKRKKYNSTKTAPNSRSLCRVEILIQRPWVFKDNTNNLNAGPVRSTTPGHRRNE